MKISPLRTAALRIFLVLLLAGTGPTAAAREKTMPGNNAIYEQVQRLLDTGHVEDARTLLQSIARSNSGDWQALNLLGNLELARGRLDQARDFYRQALERDPSQADIYNNIGVLELKAGRGQKAIGQFLMAIRLDPENVQAMSNLAMIYEANGRKQEAIRYLQRAAIADPAAANLQLKLIAALLDMGRMKDAARQCQILVDHHANNDQVRTDLGFLLFRSNLIDDAAGQFGRAVNINRKNGRAWYGLGLTARRLGQTATAIQAFTRATRLDPDQPDYLADLAMTHMALKTTKAMDKAEAILEDGLRRFPDNRRLLYLAGLFHDQRHHPKQALAYYEKVYARGLRQPEFLLNYAELLLQTGKNPQGRALLSSVLQDKNIAPATRTRAQRLLQQYQ